MCFPVEFERLVPLWNLSDSKFPQLSLYSTYDLYGLNFSSDFQILQPLTKTLGDPFKNANILLFSQFSGKIQIFVNLLIFFHFHSVIHRNGKIHKDKLFFFLSSTLVLVFGSGLWDLFLWQNPIEFHVSHFLVRILNFVYTIWSYVPI